MNKVFASLGSFYATDSEGNFGGLHLGARVACTELQKNIIQHGGFDCCHFLLGRGELSDEDVAKYIQAQGWDPRRILIYDGALPLDRLRENNYHVIHKLDMGLNGLFALRQALGHPLAPGTGMTHTISYAHFMPVWMDLLLGSALPCDAIVCTSKAAREVLEKSFELLSERLSAKLGGGMPVFRGLVEIIPLGVDVKSWHPETDESKTKAKRDLDLPERSCVILCPARFSTCDKMDLRPFLIAVRKLLGVLGADFFRVVLVGDDLRLKDGESRLIHEFVDKLGLSAVVKIDTNGAPSNIRQYYRAADIFVSLVDNVQETFGLTVIQAMACNLPVVVSDWDGYKDTVVHGKTGLRVRTYWADCDGQISTLAHLRSWTVDHLLLAQSVASDIEEIFNYLYLLATNPDFRRRLGDAGRRRAEETYAWPVVIQRYRELWDECHERFEHLDLEAWSHEDHGNIFSPAYFRQFAHYPSAVISRETQLALLSAGTELGSAPCPPKEVQLPPQMASVFDPAVFHGLMGRLSDWPISFAALVDNVSRDTERPQDLVARHVMWLMKYGVVGPIKPRPNAHSVIGEEADLGI